MAILAMVAVPFWFFVFANRCPSCRKHLTENEAALSLRGSTLRQCPACGLELEMNAR